LQSTPYPVVVKASLILYRKTARARTSFDDIVNFVAIDSPIVSEFTRTLAVSL